MTTDCLWLVCFLALRLCGTGAQPPADTPGFVAEEIIDDLARLLVFANGDPRTD